MTTAGLLMDLQLVWSGHPWMGASMVEILSDIDEEKAMARIADDEKNICEIVMHIRQWRQFVVERLEGNESWEIGTDIEDFPSSEGQSWRSVLRSLLDVHESLKEHLEGMPTKRLLDEVAGRSYNFGFLIHGLIQHDIYHLGQIGLLKGILSRKKMNP